MSDATTGTQAVAVQNARGTADAYMTKARSPSPFSGLPGMTQPSGLKTSYGKQLSIYQSWFGRVWLAVLIVVVALAPLVLTDFWLSILNFAAIYAIAAIGLNLLTGFTGQVSLGHAFFVGLGAYTAGYLGGDHGLPFIVWLPAAGIFGALVGLIIGPFALRLKGLYLAIVTIGLVFVGEHLFLNLRAITGGPQGRSIPSPQIGGLDFSHLGGLSRQQSFYLLSVPLLALAALFAKNVVRSRPGRAFQAIRDREIAAGVIGVNLARYKVGAFALSSFYAAAAGALYGSYLRYTNPESFNLVFSIQFVAMIIVGGIGTIFGSILGALFLTLLPALVEEFSGSIPFISHSTSGSGGGLSVFSFNQIIFGVLIIVFLVGEPLGLAGLWRRIKVYFRSWPFSY
ncbi:MAG: branched-chain amino acid ABC transporter permease [Actinomycetota bacterium]